MTESTLERMPSPTIIQGGMGIAVSSWQLASAVAQYGHVGIVSGTSLEGVMVRELQEGDPSNRRQVLRDYPDQEIVKYILDRFFVPGGKDEDEPYNLLPMHRFDPTEQSQRILAAAAYSEVRLARRGHDGIVGINLLAELTRFTLPTFYGAMLAGVDAIVMGAGIPKEEAEQVPKLAAGEPARLRLEVDKSQCDDPEDSYYYEFDPSIVVDNPPVCKQPDFYPIIASDVLAKILDHKLPSDCITGWIIEGPVAGGHNAPPRNKKTDEEGNPIYDEKDKVDLERVRELGYPYFLAGGYGSPEGLREALDKGARGIQVGSLFSLTDESGYPLEYKREMIQKIHQDDVSVRTDGRISPTGFPFKVVEMDGTLGIPENRQNRQRICDLGYLQKPYLDEEGRLKARCSSEPVEAYVRKGGDREETEGRGCLCNGLMANIGLGQQQKWGEEGRLFTGGDELVNLPLGSIEEPHYDAKDVLEYLLSGPEQEDEIPDSWEREPMFDMHLESFQPELAVEASEAR